MEIVFRYTKDEYFEYKQLNRWVSLSRWKLCGLSFLCALPSFALILCIQSLITTLIAGTLLLGFAVLLIVSVIIQGPLVDRHDRHLTIDESGIDTHRSGSRWQSHWAHFDAFETSDKFYLLRRLDRYTAIPKRSLDSQQTVEFLRLCEQVENTAASNTASTATVPLFSELFDTADQTTPYQFTRYQFAYQSDDVTSAIKPPLKIVDVSGPSEPSAQKDAPQRSKARRLIVNLCLTIILGGIFFNLLAALGALLKIQNWTPAQFIFLVVATALPFLIFRRLNRWLRSLIDHDSLRIPNDELLMQLQTNGWAIGYPASCQFFDWRDIQAFYQNSFCLGFYTSGDNILLIPKRIFADPDEAEGFLQQAINLRREYNNTFEPDGTVVETDNPYQSPSI